MKNIPKHYLFPLKNWEASYDVAAPTMFTEKDAESLILPDPPWAATRTEADDVAALHYMRRDAMDTILREAHAPPLKAFCHLLDCTYEENNAIDELMKAVVRNADYPVFYFKKKFLRARPYHVNGHVCPVFSIGDQVFPDHPAYPSGHSTMAHTIALVLAELDETREFALLEFAHQIARNREIAGLHFASDTFVGIHLATLLIELLKQSNEYKALFDTAKTELRRERDSVSAKSALSWTGQGRINSNATPGSAR